MCQLGLAVTFIATIQAHATPIEVFTLSDAFNNVITWQLPVYPVGQPNQKTDGACPFVASSATCMATTVTINGIDNYDTVEFFGGNSGYVGDLVIMPAFQTTNYTIFLSGAVLFHGNTTFPAFYDGTFNLPHSTYSKAKNSTFTGGFTLTTAPYVGPPPHAAEPSSLVLFGTGILGLAGVIRRKLFV